MYNVCNTGIGNRCGYGVSTAQSANGGSCGCSCGCWNGCWQRVCRDACGNLIVRNTNHCNACSCGCGCCNQSCGSSTGNGSTAGNNGSGNANGVFRCVTYCGYGNGAANNRSAYNCGSAYYAQQYGLSCDGSGECAYSFTND